MRTDPLPVAIAIPVVLTASAANAAQPAYPERPIRLLIGLLVLCSAFLIALSAHAQTYPNKRIHIIIPFGAGSSTDQMARALGQTITEETKQPVIVEAKSGGNGVIGVQAVASAAPDGYTVLIGSSATHGLNQFLYKNIPYDAVKDFSPVTPLSRGEYVFAVNPKSPAASIRELIEMAKKQPGKVTLATGTVGSRLAGALFQQLSGAQLLDVPYKTIPAAMTDLIGGQVDMTVAGGGSLVPQIKSGRLRALAVTGPNRWESLPETPTLREAGVPANDFSFSYWTGAWLPAKAPEAVIARLNELLVKATQAPAAQRFYAANSVEPFTMRPQEFARFQATETERMGRLIKAAGIKPE